MDDRHQLLRAQREKVKKKIVALLLSEMEEEGKGNLTVTYSIWLLEDVIRDLEKMALMTPVRNYLEATES